MNCEKGGCGCRCIDCFPKDERGVDAPELGTHCWRHGTLCHVGCNATVWQQASQRVDAEWVEVGGDRYSLYRTHL